MWCPGPQCLGCASAGDRQTWAHARIWPIPEPWPAGGPGLPTTHCGLQELEGPPGGPQYQLRPRRPSQPGVTLPMVVLGHHFRPLRRPISSTWAGVGGFSLLCCKDLVSGYSVFYKISLDPMPEIWKHMYKNHFYVLFLINHCV